MLPDFIALKKELSRDRAAAFSDSGDPLLSEIRTYVNHEGNRFTQFREDGSQETLDYEAHAVPVEISLTDVQKRGDRALQEAFEAAKEKMTLSQKELLFRRLSDTVPKFDAGGRPLTAELMIESWEGVEFEFDGDGNWVEPRNACGPALKIRLEAEYERLRTEPNLIRRMKDLLARKKKEWDVRQANRKLVD